MLSFGVILNGLELYLLLFTYLKNNRNTHILRYVALGDFCFALVCLIHCILNWQNQSQFAAELGCAVQAWHISFFTLCTAFSMSVMAYLNYKRFLIRDIDERVSLLRLHLFCVVVAAILSTVSLFDTDIQNLHLHHHDDTPNPSQHFHRHLQRVTLYAVHI